MLVVHGRGDRRPERLLAEIPGRAPGQAVTRLIAALGQDRGIELTAQVPAPGLATARVFQATAEAGPAIDLDQQFTVGCWEG
jgi:glycosyltransferase A (GT-A) superfamily protein (DUF2064 family)